MEELDSLEQTVARLSDRRCTIPEIEEELSLGVRLENSLYEVYAKCWALEVD